MKNIFIINAHTYYPFAEGKLNSSLIERMSEQLKSKGYDIRLQHVEDEYSVDEQVELHKWADVVIVQAPVNWMGMPWKMKKYMDEVYTQGMMGELSAGDGRSEQAPKEGYGSGGLLTGKKYMLSLTFNAPAEAFDDKAQYLFEGKSVDDLFFPSHMNFKFFAMEPLPTFACYDVMKNPEIEKDFERLTSHINDIF
ncbi:NAD(P)H-dependent oxidoreductase [Bermanella marisrubri]|uniref:Flavodoxin-like fold domain protein n=1 Tax=Bermanella marisrubri TaxID=207949 RepID=Q1MYY8_9GAMM|nr:NAD(P)H-dependent oxidoreductase [Bermanella marisrubri]EAT11153.1 flavodoxin-like fold domain protein [Oceanobacter sp. RED65] [Bermanella marisrubri]QIZ83395.1 NAD(P)H-dependent oxidoreductase [Bermanella marisrubri]